MAEPYLSEIRIMSFSFPPKGWAHCNGQLLPIMQNQALFSLLGTMYGGDGRVDFALPDLQGRTPIHVGNWHMLGERGGEQAHTLSTREAGHTHIANANPTGADSTTPAGNVFAVSSAATFGDTANSTMLASQVGNTGGSQAHLNMQPFLALNFCIALQGIFPSQT